MQGDPNDYSAIYPEALPYLKLENLKGRPIPVHMFHDGKQWQCWFSLENRLLQPLQIRGCIESIYLAAQPARNSDAYFLFINFIYKHVDLNKIQSFTSALLSDILNIGASLKKMDLIRSFGNFEITPRLVTTELEYLLLTCRSIFDLLQEIVSRIWDTIHLIDSSTKKKELPKSFARIVLCNNVIQSPEDIQKRFGISPRLAEWYSKYASFFCKLRDVRDSIVHQPIQEPLIYVDEKGFSIGVNSSPLTFRQLMQFPEEILENGSIGSLNYFVAYFVRETLAACEDFAVAICKEIQFPPDFAPDYHFFMRSPTMSSLLGIERILTEDPWAEFTLPESF
jgi:hypothetical protein